MHINKVFLLFYTTIVWVSSLYCYWNTGCPYKYFSSKTPYDLIRGDVRDAVRQKGCEPISIWGIFRHGQRYPGKEYATKMQNAMKLKKHIVESKARKESSLCAQDIDNIKNWNPDPHLFSKQHELTDLGRQELFEIGSRLKEAYPDLLNHLSKEETLIRPAEGSWIEDSAKGFVKGLGVGDSLIDAVVTDMDNIAPYMKCQRFLDDVKRNPHTYEQVDKYHKNVEYLATKDRIQRRTGIAYDLTTENMTALYDLCRYLSSPTSFSPWCAIFTTEDLQVFEYEGDLRHFYRNSNGNSMNAKFGKEPLKDLLKSFQEVKDGAKTKLTAYFSHATMMDMIYTALGLFQDSFPLSGAKRARDRQWRSSLKSPFGANLVAVLNRCTKDDLTKLNVAFYLNEEPLIQLCDRGVCSWDEFENIFTPFNNSSVQFCN